MKNRSYVDPELHLLRSIIRSQGDNTLETARFKLYEAFQAQQPKLARRWCESLRVGLLCLEDDELRKSGLSALDRIVEATE